MSALTITQFDNARAFLDVAGPLLYEKEAVNSLMLGICERLVRDPDAYKNPFFAVVRDETGTVRFAVIMTPPHNMVLADGKDTLPAIPFLMDNLLDRGLPIPGVTGPVHLVEAFTARWRSVTGQEFEVIMRQRVYELREVRMPPIPSGHFRVARSEDIPTIIDWYKTFVAEAMNMTTTLTEEEAGRWVDDGNIFVWDLEGDSVSIAMKTRPYYTFHLGQFCVHAAGAPPAGLCLRIGCPAEPAPVGFGF